MDPVIVAAAFGFFGVCVVALVPILQYRQGVKLSKAVEAASRREDEAAEARKQLQLHQDEITAAVQRATAKTNDVGLQVISLAGTVDGNLTRMIALAEAAASAQARLEERAIAIDDAAKIAHEVAIELQAAKAAPAETHPPAEAASTIASTVADELATRLQHPPEPPAEPEKEVEP